MCDQRHCNQVLYVSESTLFSTPTVGYPTCSDKWRPDEWRPDKWRPDKWHLTLFAAILLEQCNFRIFVTCTKMNAKFHILSENQNSSTQNIDAWGCDSCFSTPHFQSAQISQIKLRLKGLKIPLEAVLLPIKFSSPILRLTSSDQEISPRTEDVLTLCGGQELDEGRRKKLKRKERKGYAPFRPSLVGLRVSCIGSSLDRLRPAAWGRSSCRRCVPLLALAGTPLRLSFVGSPRRVLGCGMWGRSCFMRDELLLPDCRTHGEAILLAQRGNAPLERAFTSPNTQNYLLPATRKLFRSEHGRLKLFSSHITRQQASSRSELKQELLATCSV